MISLSDAAVRKVVRRDRAITLVGLAVLCGLAWLWLIKGAGMGAPTLALAPFPHLAGEAMAAMPMPAAPWDARVWAIAVAMWWTMMVAMMAPAASPTILLYARVRQRAVESGQAGGLVSTWAFTAAYLAVWLAFSLVAASLQWALEAARLLAPMAMGSASKAFSVAVLAGAGIYQLSPLQGRCLSHCRSPAAFLSRHWRPGPGGGLRLGAMHGAYCVGCCWALMALLFVGGVMNLAWIAALTLAVAAEKLLPAGRGLRIALGIGLLAWAGATALN